MKKDDIFCVSAVDEFGRKFNYNYVVPLNIWIMEKRQIYIWLFEYMVGEILRPMGTAVYAEWECEIREWDFGTSTEV